MAKLPILLDDLHAVIDRIPNTGSVTVEIVDESTYKTLEIVDVRLGNNKFTLLVKEENDNE